MENTLFTTNLSIGYTSKKETKTIYSNINLSLKKGKLIALIGENGIGKSTLLRTLIGIQKPITGNVFIENKDIKEYSNLQLAQNLSIVLTETLPPSNLTVFELIALGRQPYTNWVGQLTDNDLYQINKAIDLTKIEHLRDKKYYEISDGQLQIVLIARALAQNTPIIILDEPTTHLDLLNKVLVLKLLKTLSLDTQKCFLFSTHDIDLAIQLSDEIIAMTKQNIVQDTPKRLVETGIFNELFDDKSISFDKIKNKFIINN